MTISNDITYPTVRRSEGAELVRAERHRLNMVIHDAARLLDDPQERHDFDTVAHVLSAIFRGQK